MIRHATWGVLGIALGMGFGWLLRSGPEEPGGARAADPIEPFALAGSADASGSRAELPLAVRGWRPTPAEDPAQRAITDAVYGSRFDFDDEGARADARQAFLDALAAQEDHPEVLHVDCAAMPCLAVVRGWTWRWDPEANRGLRPLGGPWNGLVVIADLPEDLPADDPLSHARATTLLRAAQPGAP